MCFQEMQTRISLGFIWVCFYESRLGMDFVCAGDHKNPWCEHLPPLFHRRSVGSHQLGKLCDLAAPVVQSWLVPAGRPSRLLQDPNLPPRTNLGLPTRWFVPEGPRLGLVRHLI